MSKHHKPSRLSRPIKEWLKIHSVALGVSGTLLVVLAGVLSLYYIGSRFSPTSDLLRGSDGATLRFQLSDRWDRTSPKLLPNSLTDGTAPYYDNDNLIMNLSKDAGGNIPSLFRIQGTLSYNSPTDTDKASLIINLPPRLILTPNQLVFGPSTYTFSYQSNGDPNTPSKQGSGTESVTIEKVDDAIGDVRGQSYRITIFNIDRKRFALGPIEETQALFASLNPLLETAQAYSPPPAGNILIFRRPYNFRMTFKDLAPPGSNGIEVPAANVDALVAYVGERGRQDRIFTGDANCSGSIGVNVCFKTTAQGSSRTTGSQTLALHQKIQLEGVNVSGNVLALFEIQNLKIRQNSIAVGQNLSTVGGSGTKLEGYFTANPNSRLKWSNTVDEQIARLYDRRFQGTLATDITSNMTTWRLNSPTSNPNDSTPATTFSSPPEGKLWRINGNFVFNNTVTFDGSGTILVNGNLTFNDQIFCSGAKRLAFIVRGNITIGNQITDKPEVQCGAFMALGSENGSAPGNIIFNGEPPTGGAVARGIFTARNNVQIPNAATHPQLIEYDTTFAANPTILFREFLDLILASQS